MILKIIIGVVVIGILVLLYARYVGTIGLVVKEYPIKTSKLSSDYDSLNIVQFSDLHFGSTIGIDDVNNLVDNINKQEPDIIVFTGDLIEQDIQISDENLDKLAEALNKLSPKIEVLYVLGNHDYDQKTYFDKVTSKLNWHLLDNTYEYIYDNSKEPIVFVGLDDYMNGKPDYQNAFSYLKENDKDLYTIVLMHEPDQIDSISNYSFDLVFAGHSHLGQVRLPYIGAIWTPYGSKKYYDEHYKVNNADLYISGGVGTSKYKVRLFDRPSISLYRLYSK